MLLILTPGFPENEQDSTCLPAQQQFIKHLQACFPGLRIIILALQHPPVRKVYRWHHMAVVSFGITRGFYIRFRWIIVWRMIRRLQKEQKPAGILSFWHRETALLGTWYSRIHGIPHYNWILGQDARKENLLPAVIRPRAAGLIAASPFLAHQFLQNHGVMPAHVIAPGIDLPAFSDHRPFRDIDILGAGSLIPLKQYDLFLDIVKALSADLPAIKAILCGKGMQQDALRRQIHRLEMSGVVTLAGEKPRTEVIRMMERTRIFLHPSSYEGFSGACLEALYAGAHVISFCDPTGEKIPHWHVVGSQEEMRRKALELLADPGLDHEPVMLHAAGDTAREVMRLFARS